MKVADIRKLSTTELTTESTKLREEIAALRRSLHMGETTNVRSLRNKRNHAILAMLIRCGLRRGELLA